MTYLELIQYFRQLGAVRIELFNEHKRVYFRHESLQRLIDTYESIYTAHNGKKNRVTMSAKNNLSSIKYAIDRGRAKMDEI